MPRYVPHGGLVVSGVLELYGRVRHVLSNGAITAGTMGASRDRHLRFPRVLCGENRQRRRQPLPVRLDPYPWRKHLGVRPRAGIWRGLPHVELGRVDGGPSVGATRRWHVGHRTLCGFGGANGRRAVSARPAHSGAGNLADRGRWDYRLCGRIRRGCRLSDAGAGCSFDHHPFHRGSGAVRADDAHRCIVDGRLLPAIRSPPSAS